ncbi:MAG: hypothetical protein ACE5HQ_06010 [Gemmatimonadota bacterium]
MSAYRRRPIRAWETLMAMGLGASAGAAVFYIAKIWLGRERIGGSPRSAERGEQDGVPCVDEEGGAGEAGAAASGRAGSR